MPVTPWSVLVCTAPFLLLLHSLYLVSLQLVHLTHVRALRRPCNNHGTYRLYMHGTKSNPCFQDVQRTTHSKHRPQGCHASRRDPVTICCRGLLGWKLLHTGGSSTSIPMPYLESAQVNVPSQTTWAFEPAALGLTPCSTDAQNKINVLGLDRLISTSSQQQ